MMRALSVVVLCGVVTYVLRASIVVALGDRALPAALRRASGYVTPAMMSALVAGALVPTGRVLPDPRLVVVALVGSITAARTRSMAWTFLAGMAGYALLTVPWL